MALFVVMSVFSGLKEFSLSFSNTTDPDIRIEAVIGKSFYLEPKEEIALKKSKNFIAFSKCIEERVFFVYDEKEHVAFIKGVDSVFTNVSSFDKKLFSGLWIESQTNEAVLGYGISQKLSIGLLDYSNALEVFVPKPGKGTINSRDDAFVKNSLSPVGIYNVSEDIDSKYVFCDIEIVQNLLNYKQNQLTTIDFKLNKNANEEDAIQELKSIFKNKVTIKNRAQLNDSLYKMLNTENIAVYLIFTLVIIIALFNLIGALIMMIIDKKPNLKTLYNLGVELKQLRSIFFFQGSLLTFFGGLIGIILGILIVYIQQEYELIMVSAELPYPVVLEIKNVLIVLLTIYVLGTLASWIASNTVSKKLVE